MYNEALGVHLEHDPSTEGKGTRHPTKITAEMLRPTNDGMDFTFLIEGQDKFNRFINQDSISWKNIKYVGNHDNESQKNPDKLLFLITYRVRPDFTEQDVII